MKKVSIVTPVYRVEKYIADCMKSVIDQTYPLIEFILVDDCGGDGSVNIITDIIYRTHKEGLEFKLVHHSHNQGVAAARSHAMQAATGDYIFCLDSDDKLMPECIERLVKRMDETDVDFVVCGHFSDKGNAGLGGHLCAPNDLVIGNEACIHALAESWFNVAPWGKLLKRSFVEKYQLYFRDGIINEDAPWTFQLCLNANRIAFLHEDLYFYRYNPNSIMSNKKQEKMNAAGLYTLQMMKEKLDDRKDLKGNSDAYSIWMRQIVLFYTRVYENFDFSVFSDYCKKLDDLKVSFSYLVKIPPYYKMCNLVFFVPNWLKPYYLSAIIKIQSHR